MSRTAKIKNVKSVKENTKADALAEAEKERRQRAKEAARKTLIECREMAGTGDLKGAARLLHESVCKHYMPGKQQGQAGADKFREAALHLLWQCNFHADPPSAHLIRTYEILDDVKMDKIIERDRLAAFAAQFPTVDEVPIMALAREREAIKTGVAVDTLAATEDPPDRHTARALRDNAEFRKQIAETKARNTPEYREKQEAAKARAKRDADRFEGLREVVERTSLEAASREKN